MTFTCNDDVIDTRDVIKRIEELEGDLQAVHEEETENGGTNLEFKEWLQTIIDSANPAYAHDSHADVEELKALWELQEDAESSPDWIHGETLINREYFVTYIEELINDCYEMPKEMKEGTSWPWRHMTMDFEAAANEAEQDYYSVYFSGVEFLIRA